jgi:hypothetical protein
MIRETVKLEECTECGEEGKWFCDECLLCEDCCECEQEETLADADLEECAECGRTIVKGNPRGDPPDQISEDIQFHRLPPKKE